MRTVGSYEAKTHLPRLLKAVEAGETITITKHGVPIAILTSPRPNEVISVQDASTALRAFRATHHLAGLTIRQLVDEGRR